MVPSTRSFEATRLDFRNRRIDALVRDHRSFIAQSVLKPANGILESLTSLTPRRPESSLPREFPCDVRTTAARLDVPHIAGCGLQFRVALVRERCRDEKIGRSRRPDSRVFRRRNTDGVTLSPVDQNRRGAPAKVVAR